MAGDLRFNISLHYSQPFLSESSTALGRPRKEFAESSHKTKKRRVEDLVASWSTSELISAAEISARLSGYRGLATVIKNASESSVICKEMKKCVMSNDCTNQRCLTKEEALAFYVDSKSTRGTTGNLRKHLRIKHPTIVIDEETAIQKEEKQAIDSGLDVTIIQSSEDDQSLNNLVWHEFDLSTSTIEKSSPLATAIAEIRMYLEEPNISRTENPLLWWKSRKLLYPTLAPLAKKYLSMVATSVPSERVFLKAGQLITERRNRLKSKHVEKLMFLNYNQLLINK
ncbi:unnamed protein product [Acanthoscelides obtectus]|uniref:HAT C-terminal dimerisation domain-containing protein n=1 Tax=Acanthoscelides obtectus TaxID=200917 RepID=A0A9P0LJD0_ACAOB|nr:unnamed protein product [Acanthoscelides obtectus]CAK1681227.1 Zinc finger BED domain-containing protein 1 [Acanthoscelides obtectus]